LVGTRAVTAVAAPAFARVPTKDEVLKLQTQYSNAYLAGDKATLGRLLDDRLVFVHGGGTSATKEQTLSAMGAPPRPGAGTVKMTKIALDTDNQVFVQDGSALVTGINLLTTEGKTADGKDVNNTRKEFCSYLWTETKAGWKLLLIHTTPQQQPRPPGAAPGGPPGAAG
jgi:hypothetical protein